MIAPHTKLEDITELSYTLFFSHFSYKIEICNFYNDPLGENGGQTIIGNHGASPPSYFGSNARGFEPLVSAETGGKA